MAVSLLRPSAARLRAIAAAAAHEELSVTVGSTDGACPAGMATNAAEGRVGDARDFAAAAAAVRDLAMFELPWLAAAGAAPFAPGVGIAVSGRVLGVWWTNVCRVVRVVDEPDRQGFVYATLRSHMMAGEERFLVERRGDGTHFVVLANSRPVHPLARVGWQLVRRMQRRFAQQAVGAIAATVARHRSRL